MASLSWCQLHDSHWDIRTGQEKLNVEIVLETNYIQMCVGTKVSRKIEIESWKYYQWPNFPSVPLTEQRLAPDFVLKCDLKQMLYFVKI